MNDILPILVTISLIPLTTSLNFFYKIFKQRSICNTSLTLLVVFIPFLINPFLLNKLIPATQTDQFTFYPFFHYGTFKPTTESISISIDRANILEYLRNAMILSYPNACKTELIIAELDRFWPIIAYHSFREVKIFLYIFPVYSIPLALLSSTI